MEERLIELREVTKTYGHSAANVVKAVDRLNLCINKGDFCGIMGGSGSGKTTLLNMIATIEDATSGEILYQGFEIRDISEKEKAKLRGKKIGFIFQGYNLLDSLTLYENIILSVMAEKKNTVDLKRRICKLAKQLGIDTILDKYPYEVSGGQQQRCACVRALIKDPDILLADEPTGALDTKNANELLETFRMINIEYGTTILLVTHDPIVASYCKRVVIMQDGKIKHDLLKKALQQKAFIASIIKVWGGWNDILEDTSEKF